MEPVEQGVEDTGLLACGHKVAEQGVKMVRVTAEGLGQVAAGIYFVRIWWGDKRYTCKLVKV